MKRITSFAFVFLQTLTGIFAQHIFVLSAADSSEVPFAVCTIVTNEGKTFYTSNSYGEIVYTEAESNIHSIEISCIGFHPYLHNTSLKNEAKVYLQPLLYELGEFVITAQYAPVPLNESAYKTTVITKQQIEQTASVNLKDILQYQAGIQLSEDLILGSALEMYGLGGENIKILVNGIPVIGRTDGNIDLSQILISDVERIEIIQGPMSVSYGTNALGGVINIITTNSREEKLRTAGNLYYETTGNYNTDASLKYNLSKNFFLSIQGGRNYFDGWKKDEDFHLLPVSSLADTNRTFTWKPKEQYFGTAEVGLQVKKTEISLRSSYFEEKITNRGYPREPYYETAFDEYYFTKRLDHAIFMNTKFKNLNVRNEVAFNIYDRTKNTFYTDLTTLEQTFTGGSELQDTSEFTLLHVKSVLSKFSLASTLNFETGIDLNIETARGKRIEDSIQNINDYAVFASMQYEPFTNFVITPGVRYAYNTKYASPVVPSLHLKYAVKNFQFRSSYAFGFRSPSLKELYFYFVDINHNIVGNTELKAESSRSFMFSPSYNVLKTNYSFSTGVTLFHNHIYNLITLAQLSDVQYSYMNVGEYISKGINLTADFNTNSYNLHCSFDLTGVSDSYYIPAGDNFFYTPSLQMAVMYLYETAGINAGVYLNYSGKKNSYAADAEGNIVTSYINTYSLADIILQKSLFDKRLTFTIGCKNIFDVQNVDAFVGSTAHSSDAFSIPMDSGRSFFIKSHIQFSVHEKK